VCNPGYTEITFNGVDTNDDDCISESEFDASDAGHGLDFETVANIYYDDGCPGAISEVDFNGIHEITFNDVDTDDDDCISESEFDASDAGHGLDFETVANMSSDDGCPGAISEADFNGIHEITFNGVDTNDDDCISESEFDASDAGHGLDFETVANMSSNDGCPGAISEADFNFLMQHSPLLPPYTGGPCFPCPAGTYKDRNGSAACTVCPAGTFNPTTAATNVAECTPCAPNSNSTSGSTCVCNPGYIEITFNDVDTNDDDCISESEFDASDAGYGLEFETVANISSNDGCPGAISEVDFNGIHGFTFHGVDTNDDDCISESEFDASDAGHGLEFETVASMSSNDGCPGAISEVDFNFLMQHSPLLPLDTGGLCFFDITEFNTSIEIDIYNDDLGDPFAFIRCLCSFRVIVCVSILTFSMKIAVCFDRHLVQQSGASTLVPSISKL
jgi:hypothetical protein